LLWAIFTNEHYDVHNQHPRLEKSYCPGGSNHSPVLWRQYGEASAKSYSNFQIMFVTAWELGYRGTPDALDDDAVAIRYVVDLINWRIIRLAQRDDYIVTLAEVLDGYNTGNPRDANIPVPYVKKGTTTYEKGPPIFTA
jgi:hypothetical protein